MLDCTDDSCPNSAVCVEFQVSVPGCVYRDYSSPSRTGQAMCMKLCNDDSDCRQSDGYICASPTAAPWYAAILDDDQDKKICIAAPATTSTAAPSDTGVCSLSLPPLPEGGPAGGADAAGAEASSSEAADAGRDATLEPGEDASAGSDASAAAAEAGSDAAGSDAAGSDAAGSDAGAEVEEPDASDGSDDAADEESADATDGD